MQKQLHKFIVINCLLYFLVLNSFVLAETAAIDAENVQQTNTQNQMELIQNDVKVNDLDIEPINTKQIKNEVIPDTKKEGKKVLTLFLKTMLLAALCAVILYFVLLFVKKFYGNSFVQKDPEEFEVLDLATPQDKQDALKSFLNRTK